MNIFWFTLLVTYGSITLGSHLGWFYCWFHYGDPYNWRVFLGPWVYQNWLDDRKCEDR